jgi:2-oxoglutarate dehydrogenase E2 component (dihydrolipoamide succinyltransferase)
MPQLGETIVEGTILKWLKREGDAVARDEPLFEISTDKVDTEVPSPVAGTVTKYWSRRAPFPSGCVDGDRRGRRSGR